MALSRRKIIDVSNLKEILSTNDWLVKFLKHPIDLKDSSVITILALIFESQDEYNDLSYIWCVSKLGNIFMSPISQKIFLRGHCAKSKEVYVKLKYVPERSCHMLARNAVKIVFFYF